MGRLSSIHRATLQAFGRCAPWSRARRACRVRLSVARRADCQTDIGIGGGALSPEDRTRGEGGFPAGVAHGVEAPKGGTRAGRAAMRPSLASPVALDAGGRGSTPRLLAFLLLVSGALFLVIGAVGTLSYHVVRSPGSPASALDAGPRPEITPQDAGIAGD